jgi:hypothetical protein
MWRMTWQALSMRPCPMPSAPLARAVAASAGVSALASTYMYRRN